MKLLLGYDGSRFADAAIKDLQLAGMPSRCDATVLTAEEFNEPAFVVDRASAAAGGTPFGEIEAVRQSEFESATTGAQKMAEAGAKLLRETFPSWLVRPKGVIGDPAEQLIREASQSGPDLVVVGSQGRSVIGRIFFGSVSKSVLDHAGTSVRICRERPVDRKDEPARILVAVDGSSDANVMLGVIMSRDWEEGTEIRLIAVDDPLKRSEYGYLIWNVDEDKPEDNPRAREWIHRVLTVPIQSLQMLGLNTFGVIRWGDAGNKILQEAEEWKADSIFMGARGLGRFRRFLLGSVSSFVAARAACSVEVIRAKVDGSKAEKSP